MVVGLPTFNVPVYLWGPTRNPYHDSPDVSVDGQLYINSRAPYDGFEPVYYVNEYTPVLVLRLPKGTTWSKWGFAQVPRDTGNFYFCNFLHPIHLNFPNEYLMATIKLFPFEDDAPPWAAHPPTP